MNGTDVLINVETAVPGTYVAIGSQQGCRINSANTVVDESSKDSRAFKGSAGRWTGTIECDHLFIRDDAAYVLLVAADRAGSNIRIEVSDDGTDIENIDAFITGLSHDFPDQGPGIVSASFQCTGEWAASS